MTYETEVATTKVLGGIKMIIASAILLNGVVYTGWRHHEIIHYLVKLGNPKPIIGVQGFIDDGGVFYTREEAKTHVIECKQKYKPISYTLTSEDLW